MAVAAAAATNADVARSPQRTAGEKAAAVPFTMLGEDPSLQPYREEGHMSFGDFIDIINPLQHIPLVSTLYRELTGDTISQPSRVMGGFLYGGPLGGMGAVVNVMVEDATGKDIGGQILSAFSSDDTAQTAQNTPPGQPIALNPQAIREQQAALAAQTQPIPTPTPQAQTAQTQPAAPLPPLATAAARAGTATAAVTANSATGKNPGISEEQAASLREQLLAGQYHPSRMPARDTTPANTLQAKQAAALAAQRRLAMSGTTASGAAAAGVDGVPKTQPAAARASQQTPTAAAATAIPTAAPANDAAPKDAASKDAQANTPVPPAMLSDVMMRNLAKYEAAKKALNPTTPTIRTAS